METVPQTAGLEVMSGCLGFFGLIFFGSAFLLRRLLSPKHSGNDDTLIRMLQDFISGHDRSRRHVERIHYLLMTGFPGVPEYDDVTTAAGSFIPGGGAPFHDEPSLAEAFEAFLSERYGIVTNPPASQEGVWPPPPNSRREQKDPL